MLKGKTAVVTGSTSGIGLAIARAMARDSANVMINGFGDKAAIEKERAGIEKQFSVKATSRSAFVLHFCILLSPAAGRGASMQ